jgi:hypothetical protein
MSLAWEEYARQEKRRLTVSEKPMHAQEIFAEMVE